MIDIRGPVNISGAVTARRARAVWTEGTLYVVKSPKIIKKYETTEPIEVAKGKWEAETLDGKTITLDRNGCPSCGYTLKNIPVEKILSA